MSEDPRWLYRQMIDAMVVSCAQGQGQISAQRVRVGVWNDNADEIADVDPSPQAMNTVLASLSEAQREALAVLFAEEFASGVFNALEVLHAARCTHFEEGYDGDPSDDFLGRMDGWTWPDA
ncbi:DUF6547 family protein [Propioniciclava soli]|uniref:DUF6547 family protein n=1 Tax=Propioniciclava soli TaxID=2775081 RepID=UPI001E60763C|nr:DUF6547 family protein [Propioniciclava soli]